VPPILILLFACTGDAADVQDLSIEVDEDVVTRVHVSWTSSEPTTARVDFGVDALERSTPWEDEPTTDHHAVLLGLPSLSLAQLQVQERSGRLGEPHEVQTGVLPSALPVLSHEGEPFSTWSLVPVTGDHADHSVLVLDETGQIVWYEEPDSGQFGSFTAEPSADGESVYYMTTLTVVRSALDGSEREVIDLSDWGPHHDLAVLPDGGVAVLGLNPGDVNGEDVLGDLIVEVDAEGNQRKVWDLFDSIDDLDLDEVDYQGTGAGLEFSHGNSLTYDAERDAYLVNLARLHRLLSIDRSTGEMNWYLHGVGLVGLDFNPSDGIVFAHDTDIQGDRLLVFVNTSSKDDCSSVATLELDQDQLNAALVDSYKGETCREVFALGSAHPNQDAGVLVAWSTEGVLEEVDEDWNSRGLITSSLGYAFGYSRPLESLYGP
jgi:hypothetical protein